MKKRKVLDAFAIMAWLQDEQGANFVEKLLTEADQGRIELIVNIMSLAETRYLCIRRKGKEYTEDLFERLTSLPLDVIQMGQEILWKAADIKAETSIAFADCVVVATAIRENASVVTGDPDFKKAGNLVDVEWV